MVWLLLHMGLRYRLIVVRLHRKALSWRLWMQFATVRSKSEPDTDLCASTRKSGKNGLRCLILLRRQAKGVWPKNELSLRWERLRW